MPRKKFVHAFSCGSVTGLINKDLESEEKFAHELEEKINEERMIKAREYAAKMEKERERIREEQERLREIARNDIKQKKLEHEKTRANNYLRFISVSPVILVTCTRFTTECDIGTGPKCNTTYQAALIPDTQIEKDFRHFFFEFFRGDFPPAEYKIKDPRKCPRCFKRLRYGLARENQSPPENYPEDLIKNGKALPHIRLNSEIERAKHQKFRNALRYTGKMPEDLYMYDQFPYEKAKEEQTEGEVYDVLLQPQYSHYTKMVQSINKHHFQQ
jgi:hypothetical protein